MPKQTTVNDAQVRAIAAEVEIISNLIQTQADNLTKSFNALYGNLEFADPVKDIALDRFMIALARAKSLADVLPSLTHQARVLREYRMPPRPVEHVPQHQPTTMPLPAFAPA